MKTSNLAFDLIREFENFEAKAYPDIAGVWTIGYGTTRRPDGKPIVPDMRCTKAEAEKWLQEDVASFEKDVNTYTSGIALQQHEFDALMSFVYNLGASAFFKSTLRSKILLRLPIEEKYFTMWNKAKVNGVMVAVDGLTRRRKAEYHLYKTGTLKFQF